ncbi:caffeoylshikimate esterase isoform X4 [Syzygium oleosum]|uniref:caffeoylshikimate esterase isoform X4 n=1 Tax=Syzygium oleosum TaxID=219896 RepID=UPI0024BB713F|nr:caffeoylshikimate esterase isoform X4 [Syzygium oleosum]
MHGQPPCENHAKIISIRFHFLVSDICSVVPGSCVPRPDPRVESHGPGADPRIPGAGAVPVSPEKRRSLRRPSASSFPTGGAGETEPELLRIAAVARDSLDRRGQEEAADRWAQRRDERDRVAEAGLRACSEKGASCVHRGPATARSLLVQGIARRFASQGYAVYALDHPGFGLSDGLHGYISSFDELVDNVIEQYTKIKERPEVRGLPRFILGQSMGGAVTLKVHLKQPDEWDGVILVAPMCKISDAVRPPEAVVKMLTLMSSILPKAKLFPQKDLAELAFRDLKKRKMAVYNVICYNDQMRLQTASELLRATNDIEARVEKVSSPLLILHGAGDKVTDPSVSKFLYEKASSKDKTLKLYEGGYHCILEGESDEKIFMALDDIVLWLDSRCSPK